MTRFYQNKPSLATQAARRQVGWGLREALCATNRLTWDAIIDPCSPIQHFAIAVRPGGAPVRSGGATVPVSDIVSPYGHLYVFHDAENCYIPKLFEDRNPKGSIKKTDGKVVFLHQDHPPNGMTTTAAGGVIYNEVLRTALACRTGVEAAKCVDIGQVFRSVTYNFVIHIKETNLFHPAEHPSKGLTSHSSVIHIVSATN